VGAESAPVLAVSSNQVIAVASANTDGQQTITLKDPISGASSRMIDAITYGAGPDDIIKLIEGSNPATPVGGQAPNPIRIQVLSADGITAVSGAPAFSSPQRPLLPFQHVEAQLVARCLLTIAAKPLVASRYCRQP